jgi:hypothetical protein
LSAEITPPQPVTVAPQAKAANVPAKPAAAAAPAKKG